MAKPRNGSLSVLKCAAIYFVILAHVPLPGSGGRFLCALAKFSVVVFFMSSGYFSWHKGGSAMKKTTVRTWALLGKVLIFHLLVGCLESAYNGTGVVRFLLSRLHPLYLKELLLYQMIPLPYAWPLWFLLSLAVTYALWWGMTLWLEKRGRQVPYKALGTLGIALLGINIALGEGRALIGLTPPDNALLRNAWLDALPCFALGALLREKEAALLPRLKLPLLWAGAAGCVLLNAWEFSRVDVVDVFLGTTVLAVLLMLITLKKPQIGTTPLLRWCRYCGDRLTFYIYVIHIPLFSLLRVYGPELPGVGNLMEDPWLRTPAVMLLSTALAVAYDRWKLRREKRGGICHEDH